MQDIYTALGYDKKTLELIAKYVPRYYIKYYIKKRNGKTRRIDAPQEPLKSVQKAILRSILYKFRAHPIAHGFVCGRGPKTNATLHLDKKYLITMDIRDFFNTIGQDRVERVLSWLLVPPQWSVTSDDIKLLAELMCVDGIMPQGAPTSPIMSNLVCLGLDKQLEKLAGGYGATITRYADDVAISSDNKQIARIITPVASIMYAHGFRPNTKKTKIRKHFQRQQITGVIVNKQASVRKEVWRNLRARLHNLHMQNKPISLLESQQIRGQIEWIKSLNPVKGNQLLNKFSLIPVI